MMGKESWNMRHSDKFDWKVIIGSKKIVKRVLLLQRQEQLSQVDVSLGCQ